jgi:tRNA (adenine37-N6)-methyltransferase
MQELRRLMEEKLDTSSGLYVQSLGHVHSCFRSCVGTPRQGLFAPSTHGKIVFQRNVSPDALIGLDQFSHLWIVFEFHKNTNGKNARAHVGLRSDSHRFTFKVRRAREPHAPDSHLTSVNVHRPRSHPRA